LATAFFRICRAGPRMFQELPAHPVADLEAQQPAGLVACGRHDEHGRDVQLALAARTAAPLIAVGPVTGIPTPGRGGGEDGQGGPDADATARTSSGD
jgi:hypothetical protein